MPSIYSDARGRIVDIDKAALVDLGWSRDQAIGTMLAHHLDDDAQGAFARTWRDLVSEPDSERSYSAMVKAGGGAWVMADLFDTNLLEDPNYEAIRTEIGVRVAPEPAVAPEPTVAQEPKVAPDVAQAAVPEPTPDAFAGKAAAGATAGTAVVEKPAKRAVKSPKAPQPEPLSELELDSDTDEHSAGS